MIKTDTTISSRINEVKSQISDAKKFCKSADNTIKQKIDKNLEIRELESELAKLLPPEMIKDIGGFRAASGAMRLMRRFLPWLIVGGAGYYGVRQALSGLGGDDTGVSQIY